ncbi:MAG: LuxR C-terminal-related transcriptional regulator [Deinococcota bacterium]|nr:LuxR C-terminal-related transcriptional regulator [Deinococcota bacterium]
MLRQHEVDAPWGYALKGLRTIPRPALVVTGNRSPHYLRDLLELQPEGLVVLALEPADVPQALKRVASGETFYSGPPLGASPLSQRERQVLRLVAFSAHNDDIILGAPRIGISKAGVSNLISSIKDKLQLRNHVALSLSYLGVLPTLGGEDFDKLL